MCKVLPDSVCPLDWVRAQDLCRAAGASASQANAWYLRNVHGAATFHANAWGLPRRPNAGLEQWYAKARAWDPANVLVYTNAQDLRRAAGASASQANVGLEQWYTKARAWDPTNFRVGTRPFGKQPPNSHPGGHWGVWVTKRAHVTGPQRLRDKLRLFTIVNVPLTSKIFFHGCDRFLM
jgi:hypothetical protein